MSDPITTEKRFTAIYDAYRQNVWSYAAARAGRRLADEITSDTFTVAWRRIGDVPEPALPWLLAVARNVARESVRADRRRASLDAELRTWAETSGGDVAEDVTDRMTLLRVLAALSEDDRELLILTAWHGLGPRDAATVVGCSPATLRVRLHRARKRLGAALDETAPPAPGADGRSRSRTTAFTATTHSAREEVH